MKQSITGTWNDDPAHFRKPSRRSFLHVGIVGGLGLTLDQFFRLQASAAEPAKEAKAKSIIHIFLPGGIAHQETFDPKPLAPIEYRGEMGSRQDQADRRLLQRVDEEDRRDRGQDHRLPIHDARRGRPRARHAQHVHGLSAQPRSARSRAWAASSPTSSGHATICRPTSASPAMPTNYAGSGYLSSALCALQPRQRPRQRGFPRPGSEAARRRR